jgi:hypothetical protein
VIIADDPAAAEQEYKRDFADRWFEQPRPAVNYVEPAFLEPLPGFRPNRFPNAFANVEWLEALRKNSSNLVHDFLPGTLLVRHYYNPVEFLANPYHAGEVLWTAWDVIVEALYGSETYPLPRALFVDCSGCDELRWFNGVVNVMASVLNDTELSPILKGIHPNARSARSSHVHPLVFTTADVLHGAAHAHTHWACFPNATMPGFKALTTYGSPLAQNAFLVAFYRHIYQRSPPPLFSYRDSVPLQVLILNRPALRRMLNVPQLVEAMNKDPQFNITVVDDVAQLAFREQVNVFVTFPIIISVHGGQLGNMYFMRSPSCLIEIFPPGFHRQGLYGLMARGLQVAYFAAEGVPIWKQNTEGNYFNDSTKDRCVKLYLNGSKPKCCECFHPLYKDAQMDIPVDAVMHALHDCIPTLNAFGN